MRRETKHGHKSDEDNPYQQLPCDKLERQHNAAHSTKSVNSPNINSKRSPKAEHERPLPPTPLEERPLISLSTELALLNFSIKNDPKIERCQGAECNKQYEVMCCKCHQIFCYRCSRTACSGVEGSKHVVNDFMEHLTERKQRYSTWIANHRVRCSNLDHEIKHISLEVKGMGQELAEIPPSSIFNFSKKIVTTLSERLHYLQSMQRELVETEEVLAKYETHATQLSDTAFAELVGDLQVPDVPCRQKLFHLRTCDSITTKACDHLTVAMNGKGVLAAMPTHLELFDLTRSQPVRKVSVGGRVLGLQIYEHILYVALEVKGEEENKVALFDHLFAEKRRWPTQAKICDIAVAEERVYLASVEETMDACLYVHNTYGRYLYKIEEGAGTRLVTHTLPNVLIVTNQQQNKVYALNGVSKEILWSVDIEEPWGAAVDEQETIWVWSEHYQCPVLFDAKGNRKQEVMHPSLTKLGEVNSISVCSGRLWVAFEEGMCRFPIGFD